MHVALPKLAHNQPELLRIALLQMSDRAQRDLVHRGGIVTKQRKRSPKRPTRAAARSPASEWLGNLITQESMQRAPESPDDKRITPFRSHAALYRMNPAPRPVFEDRSEPGSVYIRQNYLCLL